MLLEFSGMLKRALAGAALGFALVSCTCSKKDPLQLTSSAPPSSTAAPSAEPEPADEVAPAPDRLQVVTLDGETHPYSITLVEPGVPRIYSRAARTWIYRAPDRDAARLGYLRAGGSAPIRGEKISAHRCAGGFFPISPRGYICLDNRATLDVDDSVVQVFQEFPPEFGRKLPYIYGTVRKPGPIYAKLPTLQQQRTVESDLDERMPRWLAAGGEIGASYGQQIWLGEGAALPPDPAMTWESHLSAEVPEFLDNGQVLPRFSGKPRAQDAVQIATMAPRVGYAFLKTFLWQGRRFGLTTRLTVMPTDRLRPIQGSEFHGFELGKDVSFPFAIVRRPDAKFHDGKKATYRAALKLSGKQKFFDRVLHYETKDGEWISDRFASRIEPAKKMPGWALKGEKWIDINLTKQSLLLYEGTEPVFATLVSTGEAGLEDHETSTATKRGIFRIHTKHVTATMASSEIGEEFELQDVPYVMYFEKGGYALHGAYWHDRFGTPKSHGCINLSPEDARRVFHWTSPQLPAGWHGVLLPLRGTVVFIHP